MTADQMDSYGYCYIESKHYSYVNPYVSGTPKMTPHGPYRIKHIRKDEAKCYITKVFWNG